jgi:hypothetical protein
MEWMRSEYDCLRRDRSSKKLFAYLTYARGAKKNAFVQVPAC